MPESLGVRTPLGRSMPGVKTPRAFMIPGVRELSF